MASGTRHIARHRCRSNRRSRGAAADIEPGYSAGGLISPLPRMSRVVGTTVWRAGLASPSSLANSRSTASRPIWCGCCATTVTPGSTRSASGRSSKPTSAIDRCRCSARSAWSAPDRDEILGAEDRCGRLIGVQEAGERRLRRSLVVKLGDHRESRSSGSLRDRARPEIPAAVRRRSGSRAGL